MHSYQDLCWYLQFSWVPVHLHAVKAIGDGESFFLRHCGSLGEGRKNLDRTVLFVLSLSLPETKPHSGRPCSFLPSAKV